MTEKLEQTIKQELAELPKEGQEAIATVDWLKITEEIGKQFLADESGVEDLQLETLLVLIGVTDPEFFAVNVENQVETTADTAKSIADAVFKKILVPIKNTLDENIKKSLKGKDLRAEQNLDFILSGGDYSALIEKVGGTNATIDKVDKPLGTSNTEAMKNRLIN